MSRSNSAINHALNDASFKDFTQNFELIKQAIDIDDPDLLQVIMDHFAVIIKNTFQDINIASQQVRLDKYVAFKAEFEDLKTTARKENMDFYAALKSLDIILYKVGGLLIGEKNASNNTQAPSRARIESASNPASIKTSAIHAAGQVSHSASSKPSSTQNPSIHHSNKPSRAQSMETSLSVPNKAPAKRSTLAQAGESIMGFSVKTQNKDEKTTYSKKSTSKKL